MLSKENRLTEEKDILFSLRSRYSQSDKFFKLVISRSKVKNFRFCFIISKKVFKKANKRNRIRRRVKAIIKNLLDSNQFKLNYYNCIVQCINKEALKLDPQRLDLEISNLLRLALGKTKQLPNKQYNTSFNKPKLPAA